MDTFLTKLCSHFIVKHTMGHHFKPTKTKSGLRCINKATGLSKAVDIVFDSFSFDTIVRGVTIPLRATRQVPNIQVTCM